VADFVVRMAGDAAVVVEFEPLIDPNINAQVVAIGVAVQEAGFPGVLDVVPGYSTVTVYFDPLHIDFDRLWSYLEKLAAVSVSDTGPAREVVVPVRYGGEFGPDLGEVAAFAGSSVDEVIQLHTSKLYRVYMVGFLPGFPYLGTVDPLIAMPRLESPRLVVPGGSVGIAGAQTGIYPTSAPGGWRLIGISLVELFDIKREPPNFLRVGDRVRFEAVSTGTGS